MARPEKKDVVRGAINPKNRESIYLKSQGKCVDCGLICGGGWKTNWNGQVKTFELNGTHEIHHIIPVAKGGKSNLDNLILLCTDCHKNRHNIERGNKQYGETKI